MRTISILALFIVLCLAQDMPEPAQEASDMKSMEGQVLAEQAKEEQVRNENILDFIHEEIDQYHKNQDTFKETESFIVSLYSSQVFEFRYKIQSNPNPALIIKIFTQENEDDISIIKDHDIGNYLEVFTSTNLFGTFVSVGKAYLRKFIHLGSHSGSELFVRLENKFERQVIVEVSLSGPPVHIDKFNVVKNSQFSVTAKKLEAIEGEMREVESMNRHKYKFQWGFLQRQEHYEEQMLKLTGFEAFVILATSIIQIYCIKSLFDKDSVI